ncbi:coniferyl aldehyde dehydrogenase [Legionella maioricensis]|uniref:Aldehyde dehydrogenase n=1 Tax=Legionella maioricensis TaxID=2896528 RepID=A0A9X2IBU4_9GAMM|nr:coniferyl aldehyde dehydrogenase [Legionella maioricensis]MCL9684591.1 coniferyl aldehyde dehydrogenase [Legionella maioricensis]MCL9687371.1 coniferyl aldehyde dehydrogenase [Legionella maioricensis]
MDLNTQFKHLQNEYQRNPYPSLTERKKLLLAIKKALQKNAYSLAEAVSKDFTYRAEQETLFLEIFPTIKAINFCLKKMKFWIKKKSRNVSWMLAPARAYLIPQPLGIVGIMVPWNYPVYLALVPAIYALASGNKVMIKMSELSPNTAQTLQLLFSTLPVGDAIQIIDGDVELSKQFASLPFGHLLFTGSTSVGKSVMSMASKNLTPVTLELGGKSPAVLSSSMNPKYFKRLFMGKLFNAAQTCIAPDYLLIPDGWEEKIQEEFKNFIHTHYPDLMNNEHYSSIISEHHKQRLLELVQDARNKGAQVVTFGELNPANNKIPIYLLFGVTQEMKVMQEEIFGPILPIICYKAVNEAVEYIKSYPNPLALYYFGEDDAEIEYIQTQTLSGALTINDTIMHIAADDLPFGGVGMSGMGQYHGQEGFNTFSKLKPVFVQSRFSTISWLYPPYGRLLDMLLSKIGGIKIKKNR